MDFLSKLLASVVACVLGYVISKIVVAIAKSFIQGEISDDDKFGIYGFFSIICFFVGIGILVGSI